MSEITYKIRDTLKGAKVPHSEKLTREILKVQIAWLKQRRQQAMNNATEWMSMSGAVKEIDSQIEQLNFELEHC